MDWIKKGWGQNFEQTFSETLPYVLDYTNLKITFRDFLSISNDTITKIVETYPGPYYLMASGGIDSQAMIYAWINSKKPFHVVSYKYNENYNSHDFDTLKKFSIENDFFVEYKNFNFLNFLENNLTSYAIEYQCASPQICGYMAMCDEIIDGTKIFSGNFVSFQGPALTYSILGLYRYAQHKKNVIPFFFQHDPEIAGCFMPYYKKYGNDEKYETKIRSYVGNNIPIIPQETKFSGFEKIKDFFDNRTDLVTNQDRLRFAKRGSKRIFDIQYRYKLQTVIRYIDKIEFILPDFVQDQKFWYKYL